MQCPKCGAYNADNATNCMSCGAPLNSQTAQNPYGSNPEMAGQQPATSVVNNIWETMKWRIIRVMIGGVIVLVIALVANWLHQFKPDEYVQAMFDVEFKAETEDYVSQDIGTKDEVLEWRGEELDEMVAMIVSNFEDDGVAIPEKSQKRLYNMFDKLFRQVSYEVKSAEKIDDRTYGVTIRCQKMTIMDDLLDDLSEDELMGRIYSMDFYSVSSEDEMWDMIAEEYVDWLVDGANAWLDNPVYEQPEDHIVYVTKNDQDIWEISNNADEILDWLM